MQHNFILSLPRSGSTVLTRMLANRKDVLCLPETFFPHLADHLSNDDWVDARKIGALFVASCSDGSPLTLDEASDCVCANPLSTLNRIAMLVATKEGRDPAEINAVVWKSTRLVGSVRVASSTGGRFLVLHRPRLNVFESQFRVPFGKRNENPMRFALFAASYDAAFQTLPPQHTLHIDYAEIPKRLDEIFDWMGSQNINPMRNSGLLENTAGKRTWHSAIDKPFENEDAQKIANLNKQQKTLFKISEFVLSQMPAIARCARQRADIRQVRALHKHAEEILLLANHSH
jgi:hypothetical protein